MKRLLFVDDERTDFLCWGEPLQIDHGWSVTYAPGPREALALLRAEGFDVIVIDRQMIDPVTGKLRKEVGDELLEEVVANWPSVCPIMLTNFGDVDAAQRDTRYGAFRYLVKNISVADLNHACEKGVQMQKVKRARDLLLSLDSLDQVVGEVRRYIGEILAPKGYRFAYLDVAPGGALLLATPGPQPVQAPSIGAERPANTSGFLEPLPVAAAVLESRRYGLRDTRDKICLADGVLSPDSGSQLLVPVLRPDGLSTRGQTEVAGILWIESTAEEAFSREDIDLVAELATYVRNAMAKRKKLEAVAGTERLAERTGLLAEVAHRICNPLQIAQSTLDLIQARLARGQKLSPMELGDSLTLTLHSLEDAIQAASLLRSERPEVLALTPLDLLSFVEEVAGAFLLKTRAQNCEVYTKADPVIPRVSLNPALVRYALNCLLDNALEAIQRRRASNGEPEKGVIEIGLHASPESGQSVLLSVRDNGCGIAEQDLPRLFDRYFTTKTEDHPSGKHGLGLWEVRRFVEAVGGIVEARPLPKGGAELRLLFPAAEAGEPSREIIL